MCNSMVYAVNSATQSFVTEGTVINFGSVVRRYGCHSNVSDGNAVVDGCGYYSVTTNIDFVAIGAGQVTVQLYKDGVAIPGAVAVLTAIADANTSVVIPTVIRQRCNCESVLTAQISGVNGTVSNASITVTKL